MKVSQYTFLKEATGKTSKTNDSRQPVEKGEEFFAIIEKAKTLFWRSV